MFLYVKDVERAEQLLDEALRVREIEKHGNTSQQVARR